jgi:hypothetical protein
MQAVQQYPQFGECGGRSQGRSNNDVVTFRWVGNPQWEPADGPVGQLAENVLSFRELRSPLNARALSI